MGYILASPMKAQQWQEIFELRWVLGFYAFYFAGRELKKNGGEIKLNYIIIFIPLVVILMHHWKETGGKLINPLLRLQGYYQNPNHLALAIVLPWAYFLGQTAVNKSTIKTKIIEITVVFLNTILLIATYSRTSWTGAALALITSFFFIKNKKFTFFAFAIFVATAIAIDLDLYGLRYRILNSFNMDAHGAPLLRLIVWKVCWHLFLDHPFFGVGFAQNARLFPEYYAKLGFSAKDVVGNAHNQFLEVLTGAGLFGLVAFLGFIGTGLYYFYKICRNKQTGSADQKAAVSALLVIIALFGSSFTDTPFRLHESRNFLIILLGFSLGYTHNSSNKEAENCN
ncbi:MAG: O-antigen ligase family protein [Bdellovibrio sp.]